jgi:hypothetical protein
MVGGWTVFGGAVLRSSVVGRGVIFGGAALRSSVVWVVFGSVALVTKWN